MEAQAKAWETIEGEAEYQERPGAGDRPHLHPVESQFEELRWEETPSEAPQHSDHDTEHWLAEARKVREEVDELVRALDAPHLHGAPPAARNRPRSRSRDTAARQARRELEQLLRERDAMLEESAPEWEEELELSEDERWEAEARQMRDEIEHLRRQVASLRDARAPSPRRQEPVRRSRPSEEREEKKKKLALLMMIADLF